MDAKEHLRSLVGREIHTLSGRPNRILSGTDEHVIVATSKSPEGRPVPISEIQGAIDVLERDGELQIDVATVGYRSAFIGAVLLTLPGAVGETNPRRVRLS